MNRLAFSKKLTRVNKILFNWTAVLVVAFNGLAAATPLFISGTAHAVPGNSGNTPTSLYFKQDGNTYQCGDTTNSSDAATLYWTAPTGVGTHDGGYKLEVNEPGYGGIYDSYPDKNDVSALALKLVLAG